jgi:agmatinase
LLLVRFTHFYLISLQANGGWTTRELLSILDGLEGMHVIGADVVEVAPIYDNPGETTVLAAAEVVHSLLSLMVETPVKG